MPKAPAPSPSTQQLSARERELLSATIDALDEHGYDRLTIDEVAARARASKATLYRRWPSKAILITAALAARLDASAYAKPLEDATFRVELLQFVRQIATEARGLRATVAGLLGEAMRNGELRASLEEHFVAPRREQMIGMLERRQAAGEIRDGIDLELAGAIPSAVIFQRLLITHEPVDATLAERIVDELMLPLLT